MLEKRYGIFKVKDGVLFGFVENSFSMGWSTVSVRQWTGKEIERVWNTHRIKSRHPDAFIVRITSNYPKQFQNILKKRVYIAWKEREQILNRTEAQQKEKYYSKKYYYRNVSFAVN